jgi:hypothetical protein
VHVGCHFTEEYVEESSFFLNLRKIYPQAYGPPKEVWRYSSGPNGGLSFNAPVYVPVTPGDSGIA